MKSRTRFFLPALYVLALCALLVLGLAGTALASHGAGTHDGMQTGTPDGGQTGTHDGAQAGTPDSMQAGTQTGMGTGMQVGTGTHQSGEPGTGTGAGMHEPEQHRFHDAAGSWFEDYADHMAEQGFMSGYADGSFGGEHFITRGQFAGIMARMMGIEPGSGPAFADSKGFWGEGYVAAMAERGIIRGRADGTFGPYDEVTRAQMAAMMDRAWELMHDALTAEERDQLREMMRELMPDVADHWAQDHIGHMYDLGVVQGDGHGHFNPEAPATRAQASAMMWRWFEAHEQE